MAGIRCCDGLILGLPVSLEHALLESEKRVARPEPWFLRGFDYPSGFNASGADHHFFGTPIMQGPDALQVGIETAFINIVSVAHIVAYHGFFSTNFTYLCHNMLHVILDFNQASKPWFLDRQRIGAKPSIIKIGSFIPFNPGCKGFYFLSILACILACAARASHWAMYFRAWECIPTSG